MATSGCPRCSAELLTNVDPTAGKTAPAPGDFVVCFECGGLYRFNESLERIRIEELPSDLDPETRRALDCARAYMRGKRDGRRFLDPIPCPRCGYELDPKKAQVFNGRAPRPGEFAQCPSCSAFLIYGNEPELTMVDRDQAELAHEARGRDMSIAELQQYERALIMTRVVVLRYMSDFPNAPPHFAFAPDGIGIIASLSAMAPAICKDDGARAIVMVLRRLSAQFDGCAEPTYMILLSVLTQEGIPFERVSLADLGIVEHDRRPS